MKGNLYLIGGGEIRNGETIEIDNTLKTVAPKGTNFVFFGTAAGDNQDYINSIKSVFNDHFNVIAPTIEDGPEFAHAAIKDASIIYLGGGTTELLLNLFEKWELIDSLHDALNHGTHLVGMSAGAQALSSWYIHENGNSMDLRQGWGFLSVCVLVHANPNSIDRATKLWKINTDLQKTPLLTIEETAMWYVYSTGMQKIGSQVDAKLA